MKRVAFFILVIIFFTTCKKTDTPGTNPTGPALNPNTIIVSNDVIKSSLNSVDSTKLVFNAIGTGIDKIKVSTILQGDISKGSSLGLCINKILEWKSKDWFLM